MTALVWLPDTASRSAAIVVVVAAVFLVTAGSATAAVSTPSFVAISRASGSAIVVGIPGVAGEPIRTGVDETATGMQVACGTVVALAGRKTVL